jgi:twinkle protein
VANLEAALTHQPCSTCDSSDGMTINIDGSTKCYSCNTWTPAPQATGTPVATSKPKQVNVFITGEYQPLPQRMLHEETCKKFRYQIGEIGGQPCHIANYFDLDGKQIAQKYRFEGKKFGCSGKPDHFFGQQLWPNGGNKLIITEGELDAMSASQVNGNKWPVVSIPSGAQSAKTIIKKHMEWLSRFQEIILMFDEDDVGREAAREVAHLLPAGRGKIARLPLKDPSELLIAGRGEEITKAMWDAKVWRPDDIVAGSELLDRLTNPKTYESIPYPFDGLNTLTRGMRKGEIVTFCAGSGIGKSQVCKVIAHHLLTTTEKKVGYIALEESIERTGLSLVGIEMREQLHLQESFKVTPAFHTAFKATVGSDRLFLYDHFGSLDSDNLLSHVRFLALALDTEVVVLDHLSIVVSGMGDGDERRIIDNTMTKLRSLVEETNIALILVSHLKRPEGRGHEEGAVTSLAQLRGSAGIAQLSDMVIGLERNQQDPTERNRTQIRVLKNRFSGQTGVACELSFDIDTGILTEDIAAEFNNDQNEDSIF